MGEPSRPEKKLVSAVEVARVMGVSRRSVTEWTRHGRYKHRRTPGGHYRIEVDADGWPVEEPEDTEA